MSPMLTYSDALGAKKTKITDSYGPTEKGSVMDNAVGWLRLR